MTCTVKADNLLWTINDIWYNQNTADMLIQKGIKVLQPSYYDCGQLQCIQGTMNVDVSSENYTNNNTIIQCHVHNNDYNATNGSSIISRATILIAGTE